MGWIRARQAGQKEERRQSILDAASELLASEGVAHTSLSRIASRCGFAKSNLYRYFESREEIFLSLYLLDTERWIRILSSRFSSLPLNPTPDSIADLLFDAYEEVPRLSQLLPWVYLSLAPALSPELGEQFLELDQRQNDRFVDSMLIVLPDLNTDAAAELFWQVRGALAGLSPLITWRSSTVSSTDENSGDTDTDGAKVGDASGPPSGSPTEEDLTRRAVLRLCRETLQ